MSSESQHKDSFKGADAFGVAAGYRLQQVVPCILAEVLYQASFLAFRRSVPEYCGSRRLMIQADGDLRCIECTEKIYLRKQMRRTIRGARNAAAAGCGENHWMMERATK